MSKKERFVYRRFHEIMTELAFCPSSNSYKYIRAAVWFTIFGMDDARKYQPSLNTAVREKYNLRENAVASSSHAAIRDVYGCSDQKLWDYYFGKMEGHPSNGELVARLAVRLHMELRGKAVGAASSIKPNDLTLDELYLNPRVRNMLVKMHIDTVDEVLSCLRDEHSLQRMNAKQNLVPHLVSRLRLSGLLTRAEADTFTKSSEAAG